MCDSTEYGDNQSVLCVDGLCICFASCFRMVDATDEYAWVFIDKTALCLLCHILTCSTASLQRYKGRVKLVIQVQWTPSQITTQISEILLPNNTFIRIRIYNPLLVMPATYSRTGVSCLVSIDYSPHKRGCGAIRSSNLLVGSSTRNLAHLTCHCTLSLREINPRWP